MIKKRQIAAWFSPSIAASILLLLNVSVEFSRIPQFQFSGPIEWYLLPIAVAAFFGDFIVWVIFVAVFLGSIIMACTVNEADLFYRFRFVLVNIVVGLLAVQMPRIWLSTDFALNQKKMCDVVELAKLGKLKRGWSESTGQYWLPDEYKNLTKTNDVYLVDGQGSPADVNCKNMHVQFDSYKNWAIEYCADDVPVRSAHSDAIKLRDNWFATSPTLPTKDNLTAPF